MKVLELFSGTQTIGKEFRANGHDVMSVELNPKFLGEPFNLTQWTMKVEDLWPADVRRVLGSVDVLWASPPCTTHSIAGISHHRQQGKNELLYAKSNDSYEHDTTLIGALHLIRDLKPKYWFVENPMGGMRKSPFMQGVFYRHTITYCQYGDTRMKPTDIWTNHPNPQFNPMCKNDDDCHESAPRGSKAGTQGLKGNMERSIIPSGLCKHIVEICEN